MSDKFTPEEAQKRLVAAVKNGDAETVAEMLSVPGIDVNKATNNGWTPLYGAAREGYTEVVKLLLAAPGIDVNKANGSGWTPLNTAAYNGHTEVVKLLLAVPGIDVNKANAYGGTPLSSANDPEVIELLKAAGAVAKCDEASDDDEEEDEEDELDWEEDEEEEEEDSEDETSVWAGEIRQMWEYKMYFPGSLAKLLNVSENDRLMFVSVCANETSNEWSQEDEYIAIYLKRESGSWENICWPRVPHDDANPYFPEEWNWDEMLDQVWDNKTVTYTTKLNEDYEQVEASWEVEE